MRIQCLEGEKTSKNLKKRPKNVNKREKTGSSDKYLPGEVEIKEFEDEKSLISIAVS